MTFTRSGALAPQRRVLFHRVTAGLVVLIIGMLLHVAVVSYDMRHFDDLFYGGESMNGSLAYLAEWGSAYVSLGGTAVMVPLLLIGVRRLRRGHGLSAGLIVSCCGVLGVVFGWLALAGRPDGTNPHELGVVHDGRVPTWVHIADVAAPLAVVVGAAATAALIMLALRRGQTSERDPG